MARDELREFLRSRRARLTPADVGMPSAGTRRTPGLRREEVAVLAGVGVSWYTWLEQGRDINVSAEVLDAIARVLRLTEPERAHLYLLAGLNPPRASRSDAAVTPELRRLLDAWPHPALLRDRQWNLLAVNERARSVFGLDGDRNCLVAFFTNERYRDLHVNWAAVAPGVVAAYRADAVHTDGVVAELAAASPEFAALWARHDVAASEQMVKSVRSAEGELHFDLTTLAVTDHPGWYVELYNLVVADPR
ncbi:helix-turn-helix transcriptional regulator [Actinophytocola algeriensis]|uniref:Transcriptional regulator with XRE-family HTH domain n=1 Tax=Actinophytocola algeriensis TaxID=1768010 RepID=A0A7W7Q5J2_9PSEU|nr:helix-turn-helix transcriptional regulator [Actinophytocola algeriensis]MBB4907121.1 transcriptional regulator with XRE-family HTH domain [Actinophytocola algeriensis]MBE1478604.1 transcriptional regulator with XRE-family HTH domain [Actinophytocola algeriensis]